MALSRTDAPAIAAALSVLDAWSKAAAHNWALVGQLCAEPLFATVNPAKEGPVTGRLLLFRGFKDFREFQLARRVPDFGVATSPLEFAHYEAVAVRGGKAELLRYAPGRLPRAPSAAECAFLAPCLWATYGLMMRLEEEPDLPLKYVTEGSMFALREGLDGKWREGPLKLPPDPNPLWEEQVKLDRAQCEAAAKLPFAREERWEADFLMAPNFHTNEPAPRFLYLLAAVDADTKERVAWEKMVVGDGPEPLKTLWEGHAQRLLATILKRGRIPGEIHVRSGRMARFLRPLGLQLPFKLVQHAQLPALAAALAGGIDRGDVT